MGGVQFVIDIDFLLKIIWVDERSLVAALVVGSACGGAHLDLPGAGAVGAEIVASGELWAGAAITGGVLLGIAGLIFVLITALGGV